MTLIIQYLQTLKPALQKMLCLYAYVGHDLKEEDKIQLSVHGTCMMGELPLLTQALIQEGFIRHDPATHFTPEQEYIRPRFWGEVLLFALEQHPEWLAEFDEWPLTRHREHHMMQKALRTCYAGKPLTPIVLSSSMPPYLVGLAAMRRFSPMLTMIRDVDFPTFITACIRKWMKEDCSDSEEVLKYQFAIRKLSKSDPEVKEMYALVNYFYFVMQGQYTPPTSIRMNAADYLLKGVNATCKGKADLALKVFGEAVTVSSKAGGEARYLTDTIAAFYWVMAVWAAKPADWRSRLQGFAANAKEGNLRAVGAAALLADMLAHPMMRIDMDMLKKLVNPQTLVEQEYRLTQRMAMFLGTLFTGLKLNTDDFQPSAAFLRHESQEYITLNKFEHKVLVSAFGNKPICNFAKAKEPWEMMLDRLIAAETAQKDNSPEEEHRVMYIIMNDGESIELREQNRLKDGRWGSGKLLPWSRFIGGTEPFMDRTDQAVVADVRYLQANRLSLGIILPHLVGTDRVYSGEHTPFRRVAIEQQKPYIIVERQEDGFHLQSNVQFQDLLSQNNVYHRDDSLHYIYFPMSEHERNILQELLSVNHFPLEAEQKLAELLPLIKNVTDVHSDLIAEERQPELADSVQTNIILRLTPDPTTQTMFDAFLLVRPLDGGTMTVTPAQGDNTIIDENENKGRMRVERDMETERKNLDQLVAYAADHDIVFSDGLNAHLSTPQVLDMLAYISNHLDTSGVEWPEGERLRMHNVPADQWNISINQRGRWFEVEGNVKLEEGSLITAQQLLQALGQSHGGYVQLQNGDYLWLSEKLRKQLDTLESMTNQEGNRLTISTLQAGALADFVHGEIDIRHDENFTDFKELVEKADALKPEPPEALQAQLRTYQREGFEWLMRLSAWKAGACLADDMGLGKTVQAIAFMLAKAEEGPSLVVAPASVVANWKNELERFAPTLNVYNINEYFDRTILINQAGAGDVLLATYGLMVYLQDLTAEKQWNTVCLDEAHNIKNRGTKTSAACMQLQARNRLILTGTPIQNHLGELWNLFQFINPGLLGSYEQFSLKYISPIENLQDKERQTQLQTLVAPFMLRRTKASVVKELPEKTEITLSVELTDDEMAFYEVIRREAEQRFREEGDHFTVNALAELTKLRRTACSPELADPKWTQRSSKVNAFMELVQNIIEGDHSVLVFSQFTSFLHLVAQELDKAQLPYLYLDGTVPVRQREQLVKDFQKGKSPIFLISLKAGGVGLNLTTANYVVHLDPWWNPAIEQQATDRAYRIGQTQAVTVYHLISHHTIEEKIVRLHQSKRALSDSILEGADQSYRLTAKEMLEMLMPN